MNFPSTSWLYISVVIDAFNVLTKCIGKKTLSVVFDSMMA